MTQTFSTTQGHDAQLASAITPTMYSLRADCRCPMTPLEPRPHFPEHHVEHWGLRSILLVPKTSSTPCQADLRLPLTLRNLDVAEPKFQ